MRTYKDGIRKGVHDSQIILRNIMKDVIDGDRKYESIRIVITNEFRDRMNVWEKFELGEVDG